MSGSGDDDHVRVKNMADLLRFCVQGTSGEDAPATATELDPERKAWLQNALKTFTVDIVQEMLGAIANIKKELEELSKTSSGEFNRGQDSSIDSIASSVDILLERTEDLDIAADFEKIGGFGILPSLLESSHSKIQIKGSELVGELVQNHEPCQKAAMRYGIMDILVKILDKSDDAVKSKALYASSCLIRSNTEAQDLFVNKLDGFSVLLRAMQSTSEEGPRLRTKAAFLLSSIMTGRSDFKEILFKMGFIEQLVGLLHQEWDQSHEHLLSSLVNFMTDFPPALDESLRPELQFKSLLQQRLLNVKGKPEFQEEEEYCKSILAFLGESTASNCPDENMER